MPELPDVESIRLYLLPKVQGKTIQGVRLEWPAAVQRTVPTQFKAAVRGQSVRDVQRRAKYLLLPLSGGQTLVLHLGMTGALIVSPLKAEPLRFAHNIFELSDCQVQFVDPRKLGRIWLTKDPASVLNELGPEPLDAAFTAQALYEKLQATSAVVKAALCDQSVVAGIGNIYADEVLFRARISPLRKANDLKRKEVGLLRQAMQKVLPRATAGLLKVLPTVQPPSESEAGSKVLVVPRSPKAPCPRCGAPIERAVVRGRGSYYCKRCQS